MTVLKNILEARKPMLHDASCTYAGTMRRGECPGCGAVGTDLSMGAKDFMSEAVDEIDTADFKLNKAGKKTKAHKIVFRTGEDETKIKDDPTKVREETTMKKTYKEFTEKYINTESVVPDSMKGKQKPYVSSDGRGNYEVLGNTGQTKATFTRKEHGMAAKDKAMAHVKKNFDAYMKEEIELDEAREYLAVHPKTDKVEHVSDSAEKRDEFIKSKGNMHKAAQGMAGQKKIGDKYMREAYFPDPKDAVSARPTTGRITRTQHRVKTTDTGAIYTKEYDPAGISKGSGAAAAEPKRGRGRPKKDKFAESFAALLAMNETQFDMFAESLSEEAFDAFTAALKV